MDQFISGAERERKQGTGHAVSVGRRIVRAEHCGRPGSRADILLMATRDEIDRSLLAGKFT